VARITETLEVALPADSVFEYLARFDHTAEWDPGIESAERIDDGPVGVGSRFLLHADIGPTSTALTYEVVRHEPPYRVTLRTVGTFVSGEDDIRIEPVGDGHCRVTWDARFGFRGPIGALVDPLLRPGFRAVGRRAVAGLDERLSELAAAA
jgi:dehydrogenase/reductase SDR family protein 12